MKKTQKKKDKSFDTTFEWIITIAGTIFATIISILLTSDQYFGDELTRIIILILALLSTFVCILMYCLKRRIDTANKKYDYVREGLEREIVKLQLKLSNTDDQWRASNHLILASQSKNMGENNDEIRNLHFLINLGLSDSDYEIDEKLVFYLTPFGSDYEQTYEICKKVCDDASLCLLRGDELIATGDIFTQIIKYIVKSFLIIVNIDGKNPNVFYELGIAHALGKNVMLISNRDNPIPFDVQQHRTLFYSNKTELANSLPVALEKYKKFASEESIKKTKSSVTHEPISRHNNLDSYFSLRMKNIASFRPTDIEIDEMRSTLLKLDELMSAVKNSSQEALSANSDSNNQAIQEKVNAQQHVEG